MPTMIISGLCDPPSGLDMLCRFGRRSRISGPKDPASALSCSRYIYIYITLLALESRFGGSCRLSTNGGCNPERLRLPLSTSSPCKTSSPRCLSLGPGAREASRGSSCQQGGNGKGSRSVVGYPLVGVGSGLRPHLDATRMLPESAKHDRLRE